MLRILKREVPEVVKRSHGWQGVIPRSPGNPRGVLWVIALMLLQSASVLAGSRETPSGSAWWFVACYEGPRIDGPLWPLVILEAERGKRLVVSEVLARLEGERPRKKNSRLVLTNSQEPIPPAVVWQGRTKDGRKSVFLVFEVGADSSVSRLDVPGHSLPWEGVRCTSLEAD
jgi:hypothetical protein